MSAARYSKHPAFIGLFARFHTLPFTFVHAVSLVNHWSATDDMGARGTPRSPLGAHPRACQCAGAELPMPHAQSTQGGPAPAHAPLPIGRTFGFRPCTNKSAFVGGAPSMSALPSKADIRRVTFDVRNGSCVDGSKLARRIFTSQAWSVQPCVRPLSAVHMTAGHNALRGSGPGH
jgi:hypothetical protein